MLGKDPLRFIDKAVLDQVTVALAWLRQDPRFDLQLQHRAYHFIDVEAGRHSVALEFSGSKPARRSARRQAEENLRSADSYFKQHYKGTLDERLLMDTAGLIEPPLLPVSYRSPDGPTTRAAGMPMIYPNNVAEQMDRFVRENNSLSDYLNKAVHTHFHVTRIHPFKDGNGRLARLAQNGILAFGGLPSIAIEPFEREQYMCLLNDAQVGYREHNDTHCERVSAFYNYLALKVRDSLINAKRRLTH